MANPFNKPSIANYNANPPSDDGAETAGNLVEWAKHIEKIGDPLRAFAEAINNNVSDAFGSVLGSSVLSVSSNTTLVNDDQGKFVFVTGATSTVTLPSASTVGSNWIVAIVNANEAGGQDVTVTGDGSETVEGHENLVLKTGQSILAVSDGANFRGLIAGRADATVQVVRRSDAGSDTVSVPEGSVLMHAVCVGAGGAGGGAVRTTASNNGGAGGGGGAGATIGGWFFIEGIDEVSTQVGAGGSGVAGDTGGDGGDTSISWGGSTRMEAGGGFGGDASGDGTVNNTESGGNGGRALGTGLINEIDFLAEGTAGENGWSIPGTNSLIYRGRGAPSFYGGTPNHTLSAGNIVSTKPTSSNGTPAEPASGAWDGNPGSGGGGAHSVGDVGGGSDLAGGDGADGLIILTFHF